MLIRRKTGFDFFVVVAVVVTLFLSAWHSDKGRRRRCWLGCALLSAAASSLWVLCTVPLFTSAAGERSDICFLRWKSVSSACWDLERETTGSSCLLRCCCFSRWMTGPVDCVEWTVSGCWRGWGGGLLYLGGGVMVAACDMKAERGEDTGRSGELGHGGVIDWEQSIGISWMLLIDGLPSLEFLLWSSSWISRSISRITSCWACVFRKHHVDDRVFVFLCAFSQTYLDTA